MATSLLTRHHRHVTNRIKFCGTATRCAYMAYYVLMPQVPKDTEKTNALLRFRELPKFSEILPSRIITGCAKQSMEFELNFSKHMERIKDPKIEKTFDMLFEPLEHHIVPLNFALRTAEHMHYVQNSQSYTNALAKCFNYSEVAKNERWINETLFYAVKEVAADSSNLDKFEKSLVNMYLLEARLNGIEIQDKNRETFLGLLHKIQKLRNDFRSKVNVVKGLFHDKISDFHIIQDMPRPFIIKMAEDKSNPARGPWTLTFQDTLYHSFLTYCSDRNRRWNAWRAYNNICSHEYVQEHVGNHKDINEIRAYRQDISKLLGFDNFAQMSMQTKMAGTVENVLTMMETLKCKFKQKAQNEIDELQQFAASHGFKDDIQMWDISYWQNQQKMHLYKLDSGEVAEYFPLPHVLHSLFTLCNKLFGVTIEESKADTEVWNENVKFYNVFEEDGSYVSSFYFDSNCQSSRVASAWMDVGRERSDVIGLKPFSYLILNTPPSSIKNRPKNLSLEEVAQLFAAFGDGLQQMLTKVPYSEIAGQRNIELDAIEVCSMVMKSWFYTAETLKNASSHYETGQPLSDELIDRILKQRQHMSAYSLMTQLYYSAYDMELHISQEHWNSLMMSVWEDYMPLPLSPDDNHPCSLIDIFSGKYAASLYSVLWAQMIAADCFDAFIEAGLNDSHKMSVIGRRFKDTFLSLGGGMPTTEIFRQFRGRDPSIDALQVEYGVPLEKSKKKKVAPPVE